MSSTEKELALQQNLIIKKIIQSGVKFIMYVVYRILDKRIAEKKIQRHFHWIKIIKEYIFKVINQLLIYFSPLNVECISGRLL